MSAVLYQVPYEVTTVAQDLGSGKTVTNKFYFTSGDQVSPPIPYAAPVAGSSSNAAFLAVFSSAWASFINLVMSHNYKMVQYVSQAIIGKRYSSPLLPIATLAPGTPITLATAAPHGLSSGQLVVVTGVTSPAVANGTWAIVVLSPTTFSLVGSSIGGVWSGDGMVQHVIGAIEFLYGDKQVLISNPSGGIVGSASPLFAAYSVQRLNVGIGRNFRSRVSLSPIPASFLLDGGIISADLTTINTALAALQATVFSNSGSDPGSGKMFFLALSHKLALGQASPFTSRFPFTAIQTSFNCRADVGSLVRRKPKLSSVLA